jgi:hypothetical protein
MPKGELGLPLSESRRSNPESEERTVPTDPGDANGCPKPGECEASDQRGEFI